ncbi:MAG: orotate phosphoribosyltransferase [Pseudobdellovibrionaceae bacterium]
MTREELAKQIYQVSHITGFFKLRSGLTSNEYFDKYRFESHPHLLREIGHHMSLILPHGDFLAGLEMGGIPVATALSLATGKSQIFVRKTAKEYGTCQFAEGAAIKGKKLIIIEDVITTGGQVIESVRDLRSEGAEIETVMCVINRGQGKEKVLEDHGLKLKALFTIEELKKAVL